jgi:putative polyhydroxyalkanoate system protein
MAKVHVQESHNLSVEEAKRRAGAFEDMFKKYGVKPKWSGNKAKVKGPGVKGDVVVTDSDITIDLKLGMIAKAAGIKADKLEASIRRRIQEAMEG